VHVFPAPGTSFFLFPQHRPPKRVKSSREAAGTRGGTTLRQDGGRRPNKLERLARQRVDGETGYEVDIVMGDPGVEVLQGAKRWGANLIVVATHGRKGFRRLVLCPINNFTKALELGED
jgi:hypothetical protein